MSTFGESNKSKNTLGGRGFFFRSQTAIVNGEAASVIGEAQSRSLHYEKKKTLWHSRGGRARIDIN